MLTRPNDFRNKVQIWLPLLLAVVLVLGILIGMRLPQSAASLKVSKAESYHNYRQREGKIEELLRYIEAKYVDKVDRDKLVDEAIQKLMAQLDPHSSYIPADELEEVNEQLDGKFDGIGVEFLIVKDTAVVVAPMSGGPSETAGILPGDKIIKVGDSLVVGEKLSNQKIVGLLRGDKGSKVQLSVWRGGENKMHRYTITRAQIPVKSVEAAYMIRDRVGYIRINRFTAQTDKEFLESMRILSEQGHMKDLVLDLRGNPGGYMQMATNMLSQLFPNKGNLLVYTQGRASQKAEFNSNGRVFYPIDKIAVLIDEGSASASEIVAGAIQDNDRGIIVGRRSFGKGLVQEQYQLTDGSALRLTIARYFTPSGRSIQKAYDNGSEVYDQDVEERFKNGELLSANKIAIKDSTKYYTTNGRVVYGGGGIIPDVFVPLDTIQINDFFLDARQMIPAFVLKYLDKSRREQLAKMGLITFQKKFNPDEQLLKDFQAYTVQNGLSGKSVQWSLTQKEIARYLKARIAKHLFDDKGFYAVLNQEDPTVQAALKSIKGGKNDE
ncbi:S41 family peptidase [Haliscomenobacter hydrossis]|uniref:Carboxyl-terminal protease n=1 Tax=Haliscomenobacter hydrossis (strain ATCC 27775 / DSM 1100 / LMG 10767 / O) TaxID=760192 RepID=F4KWS8_HALH1|nr:S41 family peptidase [Haliscomenobacter hydrossis]AEE52561.1 carboxyl-terminal protease [Haliscomenobacter hydrossis DSM 1100]